ncbi:MAG: RNA polymerase sigma factor [Planctomycetota bacterium]
MDEGLLEGAGRERPRLVAIAARVLGDAGEAEDVAQEVLVRLAGLEQAPASLPAWLTAVCYRLAIDRRRRRARRASPMGAPPEGLASEGPAEAAERRDEARRALIALEALPEPYREALRQRFCAQRAFPEIAQAMGAPERTVRTWVGRGLTRLRQVLAGGGDA